MRLRSSATFLIAAFAAVAAAGCATSPESEAPSAPAAAATPAPAAPAAPAASTAAVAKPALFAVCSACHGTTADAPPGLGPNLVGVVGKKAGTAHPDFDYSDALKNSGKVWTPETLAAFLQDPAKVIPGNDMDYPGVPDAATAKQIADYMATLH